MKFGVNVQIFGFGIFQEGPEFLQPIELTCRERGERGREMLGQRVVENKQVQRRGRYGDTGSTGSEGKEA